MAASPEEELCREQGNGIKGKRQTAFPQEGPGGDSEGQDCDS